MTAKLRQQASPAQFPSSGQAGSLMGTLQQEVAAEASPMLFFLTRHARFIVLAFVLFIVAIIGYWFYDSQVKERRAEEVLALGRLMLISDHAMRQEKLQAFAADAPGWLQSEVLLAIVEAAGERKDYDTVYNTWKLLGDRDPALKFTALVGMADALSAQEKYREALTLLDGASGDLKSSESGPVNSRIVLLAENLGEHDRAMVACDALLAKPGSQADVTMWTQKKNVLAQKAAAAADAKK